jgi:hypothetical protein
MTSAMRFQFSDSVCSLRFPAAVRRQYVASHHFPIRPIRWQSRPGVPRDKERDSESVYMGKESATKSHLCTVTDSHQVSGIRSLEYL